MTQQAEGKTVWTALAAPLPKDAIKQRQGPGGRMLDYIDWPFIQDRLDAIVPGKWTLELTPIPIQQGGEDPFAVKATLTIGGVKRENIGAGKDWKEAATDASKRAAVRFGIGLELYEKSAGNVDRARDVSTSQVSSPRSTSNASAETTDEPSCPKCGGRLWDNRAENDVRVAKGEKLRPDWKCRTRTCDGVIWRKDAKGERKPTAAKSDDEAWANAVASSEADDASLPF